MLKPFFDDLEKLNKGIDFIIMGQEIKYYAKVILCLCDTEGQHQIGGFKVGVGWSHRKCRMCYVTRDDIQNNFNPGTFISRSKAAHNFECNQIEDAPNAGIKGNLQTTHGIIYRSCLLNIPDFDMTKQLPHDIMHVLLEGVVPYECQLALSALMDQGLFSLDDFNFALQRFEFNYSDCKSKPEALKSSVFVTGERKLEYSAENARVF